MEISHYRGPVRGHRGAAGIGSLRYHWRLSLDANLLLIPQLSWGMEGVEGLEYIPIRLDFNRQYRGRHDTKHHPHPQISRHHCRYRPWQISALQSTCLSPGHSNQRVNPIQYLSPWLSQISDPGEANPLN